MRVKDSENALSMFQSDGSNIKRLESSDAGSFAGGSHNIKRIESSDGNSDQTDEIDKANDNISLGNISHSKINIDIKQKQRTESDLKEAMQQEK